MKRLAILGATGSIGVQALAVAARHPERLRVAGLAAGAQLDALVAQAHRWQPEVIALEHPGDATAARAALAAAAPHAAIHLGPGASALLVRGCDADIVLNGIVGAAGLGPSLAALEGGRTLALANKETLVIGGPLVQAALARAGRIVPVDSEHSAALQCLGGRPPDEVRCLTLTASGGPLRRHPRWELATPAEVRAHPVWAMGARITVDSALLVNKGLELIEARWLFDLDWPQLQAVLHPAARVHAWVEFRDGSVVAQAAIPDMRLPIQLAMSWPERWPDAGLPALARPFHGLEFADIPVGRYPAFEIVCAAGRTGGTAPCALNAADEVAVAAFLDGAVELGQVPGILASVLEAHRVEAVESLEQIEAVDAWARTAARAAVVRV